METMEARGRKALAQLTPQARRRVVGLSALIVGCFVALVGFSFYKIFDNVHEQVAQDRATAEFSIDRDVNGAREAKDLVALHGHDVTFPAFRKGRKGAFCGLVSYTDSFGSHHLRRFVVFGLVYLEASSLAVTQSSPTYYFFAENYRKYCE